jgi:uncharacterized protein (DUF427 family)
MAGYPKPIARAEHVEPVPRRIRAMRGGEVVVDTTDALYVWEWPAYPQYYLPRRDVREDLLASEGRTETGPLGATRLYSFADTGPDGPVVGRLVVDSTRDRLVDTFRFEWEAFDAWFEEDEEVFVHPRNPYTRVDALRSTRTVRVELEGVVLAETSAPVLVFETGLPTRYYLNRTDVRFAHLEPSPTVTSCPYKGTTSNYWSAVVAGRTIPDLAWSYRFPTRELLPIAGLVAFYNERVDLHVDGERQERPFTSSSND